MPLALTSPQLALVFEIAGPIPRDLRDEYLRLVAQALSGRDFGDGDVYRACAAAAKQVMWDVVRDAGPSEVIGDSKLCATPIRRGRPIDPAREQRADRVREENARRRAFDRQRASGCVCCARKHEGNTT